MCWSVVTICWLNALGCVIGVVTRPDGSKTQIPTEKDFQLRTASSEARFRDRYSHAATSSAAASVDVGDTKCAGDWLAGLNHALTARLWDGDTPRTDSGTAGGGGTGTGTTRFLPELITVIVWYSAPEFECYLQWIIKAITEIEGEPSQCTVTAEQLSRLAANVI